MSTLFLIDNSVSQRLHNPLVRTAWSVLSERGELATCLPTMLEAGYSARSAHAHSETMHFEQASKIVLPPTSEDLPIALRLQGALFAAGMGRAVGVNDLQIAATAIQHSKGGTQVVVVHYDTDFDHLASVEPRLATEWIVPRGSVA